MTKTITKTTLAALALGMTAPAMAATDGSPGATSTGSFDVSVNVATAPAATLQVFGLDNLDFGTIIKDPSAQGSYITGNRGDFFCIYRSNLGQVNVQINKTGDFFYDLFIENPDGSFPTGTGTNGIITNGNTMTAAQSGSSCGGSSGQGIAHVITARAIRGAVNAYADGLLTSTVTITLSLP